jgi:aspartate-semialdehyde dehydrogenase
MKVAVVGATGLVGTKMLEILGERSFPFTELIPIASERSVGRSLLCCGKNWIVRSMTEAIEMKPDIAIFSAGGDTSLTWAPQFAAVGTTVIDNSSAWRMKAGHKLIVPEINASELTREDKIIANPNCSTIQLVVALKPLHDQYKLKRLVISTYQSITGTGVKAVAQMEGERVGQAVDKAYPHPIDRNCIPQCDMFLENGYTKEEMKMVHETRKILGTDDIQITATAVRVPVVGGHSEAVNVEFHKDFKLSDVVELLKKSPGVTILDDPANSVYPMPLQAHNSDEVFVGRIRRDDSQPNTLNLWIVSDNLRKGAATNAVQIAEYLCANNLVG